MVASGSLHGNPPRHPHAGPPGANCYRGLSTSHVPSTRTGSTLQAALAHRAPESLPSIAHRGLVLLDRDGTLIRDVPFLDDPAHVELMPGVGEGLAALQAAGFALAIVTNQQGVGLGYSTTQQMIAVNQQLFRELGPFGVRISKIYYCPHTAADHCGCRKPESGLVRRALRDFEMGAARTFVVGVRGGDAAAGKGEGGRTILLRGARGEGDYTVAGFAGAACLLLDQSVE